MTNTNVDNNEGGGGEGLDPLTTLATEFAELKKSYESLASEVKKISLENTQLLETNRKLVGASVEEVVVEPQEADLEEIMLKKFYTNLGIEKMGVE